MDNWHKLIAFCSLTALSLWGAVEADFPFVDAAGEVGIEFLGRNGAAGRKQLPETMGAGVVFRLRQR
ncbi:MAG: hypothetical protein QGH25_05300 [Candidatus Latescibacteria bacterium]|jgi:hypothetical protein|nr:hypothetical protein [Candidatus Latescibacterota bacterium]